MKLEFKSKAQTLLLLKNKIQTASICEIFILKVADWINIKEKKLFDIKSKFGSQTLIVRSSSLEEDNIDKSNAGKYLSVIDINLKSLENAINNVINSYKDNNLENEVLIQPMLKEVIRSGVAFSHDPNTNAPYRVINWSESNDTTLVTGGAGGNLWLQSAASEISPPKKHKRIIDLVDELYELFDKKPIDIEFAVTRELKDEKIWLLQIRPLILKNIPETNEEQKSRLLKIEQKIRKGDKSHPFLMGKKTIYGVMPDWNPAEIIGIKPRPLSLSLYRDLITDSTWAYQRNNYGYRNLRSFPLMTHFFGLPYIDVRVSFNSFIPVDLEENLAGKLVDYYIDRLLEKPKLHDKIEFEIVFSCYTLNLKEKLKKLDSYGFSNFDKELISNSLLKLTNKIIHPKTGLWKTDYSKINKLNERRNILYKSSNDLLEKIYWLLEDGKRYGTLPFAGLARAGFISVQMLRSIVELNIFSEKDYDHYLSSLSTISSQICIDKSLMNSEQFLKKYGHLRPGTYDIMTPRYDEEPQKYFNWESRIIENTNREEYKLSDSQSKSLTFELKKNGLNSDSKDIFNFIKAGIELREEAKFHFTKNLSDALSLITKLGEVYGFSREDISYCDIKDIKELYITADDAKYVLAESINRGKKRYEETSKLCLPPVINEYKDIWGFQFPEISPNFITQKQIIAKVEKYTNLNSLNGAIVCIDNADPGFDWLFSHSIAGLITAWGGANSHMAIRAGELGLPSVIGAGEIIYKKCSSANVLFLDCAGKRIEVVE